MSIMSKIKGVEVVGDGDAASVLQRIRAHEARASELDTKLTSLAGDVHAAQQARDQAAYEVEVNGLAESEFTRIAARVDKIKSELRRTRLAQKANSAALSQATDELDRLGRADLVRQVRRLATARQKAADSVAEALAAYGKAFDALSRNNEKIISLLGRKHELGGLLVKRGDTTFAVEREIARVSGWEPLAKGGALLPGQRTALFGNPAKFTALADAIKDANSVLIERVENGPAKQSSAQGIAPDEQANKITDGTRLVRAPVTLDMGGDY